MPRKKRNYDIKSFKDKKSGNMIYLVVSDDYLELLKIGKKYSIQDKPKLSPTYGNYYLTISQAYARKLAQTKEIEEEFDMFDWVRAKVAEETRSKHIMRQHMLRLKCKEFGICEESSNVKRIFKNT